jgi:hypothetical protein
MGNVAVNSVVGASIVGGSMPVGLIADPRDGGMAVLAAIDQLEFATLSLDLRQQAFPKISGGDAYRIELADDGEASLEVGFRTVKHGLRQLREGVCGAAGGLVLSVARVRLSVGFVA